MKLDKKTIIQLVVVVACFGGSAWVLLGYFSNARPVVNIPSAGTATGGTGASVNTNQAILPAGSSFDLPASIKKSGLNFTGKQYPKLDPKTDLGVNEKEFIKPVSAKTTE